MTTTHRLGIAALLSLASLVAACGGKSAGGAPHDGGTASSGSGGGSGGSSGGQPPIVIPADKIDLLFMIDNSSSMGDKQALLALAVPDLVSRLVSPNCLDATGHPTGQTAQP